MKTYVALIAVIVGVLIAARALLGCSQLTPADKDKIAKDQIELGVCLAEAHFSKLADAGPAASWAVFDGCMVRKGFYDGGSDAR